MKVKNIFAAVMITFLGGCVSSNAYLERRHVLLDDRNFKIVDNTLTEESTSDSEELKFGIVSDIHGEGEKAGRIAGRFSKLDLDGIIVAGDISRYFSDKGKIPEDVEIRSSLIPFLETKVPVYVIAGNHETKKEYFKTLEKLSKENSNLFDLAVLKYADLKGVNIFGVSGGDFILPLGGFSAKLEIRKVDSRVFGLDSDPVLMISHLPPKFNHEGAIDCVYDVKIGETFKKEGEKFVKGDVIKDRHIGEHLVYEGRAVLRVNGRNEGVKKLSDLLIGRGINFSVSGHYHLNRGANNFERNIEEGEESLYLFMTPGAAQFDNAGILIINGESARYELLEGCK